METRWTECWNTAPDVHTLLKESRTLESAREKLLNYIEVLDSTYRRDLDEIESWHYILLKEAVLCLKNIVSQRNERLAGTSSLKYVWEAAREGDAKVTDDFVEEFVHLFKAIKGKSEVYPSKLLEGIPLPDFDKMKGRESALKRSDFLDKMGERVNECLDKYPSGYQEHIIESRRRTKEKILEELNATQKDWDDWRWHFRNAFRDLKGFQTVKKVIELRPSEEEAIDLALKHDVPIGVTPHYLHLMDRKIGMRDFVIRRQVFPPLDYVKKMIEHKEDRQIVFDFMREHDTSPIDLVTRRYPKVAIIKPYHSCPQICVYCQRNWEQTIPLMKSALPPKKQIDNAINWFAEHDQIIDVLVTGGDPLVIDDKLVDYVLGRLAELPHISSIRIATRIPITVPQRITDKLCEIFAQYHKLGKRILYVVTHFEHPYEVTRDTTMAIERIKKLGIELYNQQVFTFANSKRFETAALRLAIKKIGVDPYYTFNMKGKQEIRDYAVPVARILQERKEEARLLPGIYRTDEPVFNVPFLGKNHLRAWQDHQLISILPDGRRVYAFHPWEKNIDKIKPYLYVDVTIKDYLDKLEEMGENPEDYKSIWYYY
jgi:lysine 2,3-aminomutase